MIGKRLLLSTAASGVLTVALGLTGCNGGSGEIPLAKVPPPPPGFGEMKKSAGTPKGGSPEDMSQYTR